MEAHFNCKPQSFSCDYTEQQSAILDDDISVEDIRATELAAIIKKVSLRDEPVNYEVAKGLCEKKKHPCDCFPSYTLEEAISILQSLTPWRLNTNKPVWMGCRATETP